MFDDFRAENAAWLLLLLPLLSAAGITLFTLRDGVRSAKISITAVVLTFVVSLGLFLFFLNAFCLWLTSKLVKGFAVRGFWAALFGAIIVSAVSWALTTYLSDRGEIVLITRRTRWWR